MSRFQLAKILLPVAVLVLLASGLHAATLVANPTAITLNCDTVLGPTPGTIGITLAAAGSAVNVTVTQSTGGHLVLPSAASVNSTTNATSFSVSMGAGCANATSPVTLTFTPSSGTALNVVATLVVTNSGSALAPSPSAVTITCTKSGSTYTPQSSPTVVQVVSPANLGTPFTVDNTTNVLPNWLTVTPLSGGTATEGSPVSLSITPHAAVAGPPAVPACGGLPVGSQTFNVHLLNAPAADKLLPVTIQVGAAATLSATPTSVSLSYTQGSSTFNTATASMSSSPSVFYTVVTSSLPIWLNVTPSTATAGTAGSAQTATFAVTAGASTLAPGIYTANVHFSVSGAVDTVVPVTLTVNAPAATLSVAEGTARTLNWTLGSTLPSLLITPISSGAPIAYTVTTGNNTNTSANTLNPQVSVTNGLAYNFGQPFSVSFLQSVFGAAAPNTQLSGAVIITPNGGSAITVNIAVNVQAPGATVSSLTPNSLPTSSSGTYTVVITGSGFNSSTTAGIVNGGLLVADSNVVPTFSNANSIVLAITVPSTSDPLLPFSGSGGTVTIGVCNPPPAGTCTIPTGSTASLTIGVNPIIYQVTSASSFVGTTPPALPSVAAYDIISLFGTNFCISGGTGCTVSSPANPILYGGLNPATEGYLTTLSPDAAGATQRNVQVVFQTHSGSPTVIASAPLLYATNNQINLIVPSAVAAYANSTVDMVVSFGYGTGATMLKSLPFSVTIAATDPGLFTVTGDGQGGAAALENTGGTLVTDSAPAILRGSTDSDIIQLYMSGLGAPDSNLGGGSGYFNSCMAPASYFPLVNSAASPTPLLTSDDGLVLQSSLFPINQTQPCMKQTDITVTLGGVALPSANILYAGWVPNAVAGLYQINIQLPAGTSSFTPALTGSTVAQLPLVVSTTGNSKTSQAGVTLSVSHALKVVGSGAAATGTVTAAHNVLLGSAAVVASDGTGPYTYSVTSGTLPAGLSLDGDGTGNETGATAGLIYGTPTTANGAGVTVTFTATDANGTTGTITITFVIT